MSQNYAGVTLTLIEMVTGERVKLGVDDMKAAAPVAKGAPIVINGDRQNAPSDGTMVRLEDGSKVYVDASIGWVRETVKVIKELAKEEQGEK